MQTNWSLAWNLVVFSHMVASIASILSRCLQFCCTFTNCTIIGGLPGILLYFMAKELVASIIYISPCCLQSCCIFRHCQLIGGFNYLNLPPLPAILLYFDTWQKTVGFNNLNFPPMPAVLLYFQTLHNYWWLAWNLVVFKGSCFNLLSMYGCKELYCGSYEM